MWRLLVVRVAIVCALGVGAATRGRSSSGAGHRSLRVLGSGRVTSVRCVCLPPTLMFRSATCGCTGQTFPDSDAFLVVYFLHGVPGSGSDVFAQGGAAVLDRMFATGTPPFVVAAPTGTGHAHVDTEWADSVDGRDRVETYLIDRVIPAVERSRIAATRRIGSLPGSRWVARRRRSRATPPLTCSRARRPSPATSTLTTPTAVETPTRAGRQMTTSCSFERFDRCGS